MLKSSWIQSFLVKSPKSQAAKIDNIVPLSYPFITMSYHLPKNRQNVSIFFQLQETSTNSPSKACAEMDGEWDDY